MRCGASGRPGELERPLAVDAASRLPVRERRKQKVGADTAVQRRLVDPLELAHRDRHVLG